MSNEPSVTPPTPTAPDFAESVQRFWENNHTQVYFLCAAVLLAIVGREGWDYFSAQREQGVQEEYAKAAGASDRLSRFADEHSGHALAGVALLQVADEKYSAADFKGAQTAYAKAADTLVDSALKSRAKLGGAMSLLAAGDSTGAENALKAIVADNAVSKLSRAEAGYQLAALAQAAGRTADVKKYAEEVAKNDTSGAWGQRAFMLLSQLPQDKAAAAPNASGINFKPVGK